MKPRIAIVRGKFLNRYEMQFFEPLVRNFDITGFGSLTPFHDRFTFPVVKLPSPMDLPEFPYKMPFLNRIFTDAHYLYGLEGKLRGFDLVHTAETYFRYTQQSLDAKKKGYVKKVIATVLENIAHNNEGIRGRKKFKKRALAELDHIIALTQKTKAALLAEGADESKITVISHFVDTKRFRPCEAVVKRRFSDRKDITILFVGRLEEYKGVFDILNAIKMLRDDPSLMDFRLTGLFVGEGSEKHNMMHLAHRLGLGKEISFTSVSYDDMPAVYEKGDIFVAPSKSRIVMQNGTPIVTYEEQYCTALLEAQAAGLPIVTTRSGGIPENISEAGLLVSPGDVNAIAHAVKSFLVDPKKRENFGKEARARAKNVHDISIGARKLSDLYHTLLP